MTVGFTRTIPRTLPASFRAVDPAFAFLLFGTLLTTFTLANAGTFVLAGFFHFGTFFKALFLAQTGAKILACAFFHFGALFKTLFFC